MNNSIITNEMAMNSLLEVGDDKKIERINTEDKNYLLQVLADLSGALEEGLHGGSAMLILGWYNAYLVSPDFAGLARERKKEVLIQFDNIKHITTLLFDFVSDHKLGIFNNELDLKVSQYNDLID